MNIRNSNYTNKKPSRFIDGFLFNLIHYSIFIQITNCYINCNIGFTIGKIVCHI